MISHHDALHHLASTVTKSDLDLITYLLIAGYVAWVVGVSIIHYYHK